MTEKKYTADAMMQAMKAVAEGASTSSAAREFNVPRTTLIDKINGRSSVNCSKGPPTILTTEEEEHLVNWLILLADSGFPVSKNQLQDSVSILLKKIGRKNPFCDDKPGRHWFEAFIKRHPIVGKRVAQNLTQTRALVTEEGIRKWFKEIKDYFAAVQLQKALEDPRRIFNCDESAFFLAPSDNRVLAKRGTKNVYNIIPSGERECVTVLVTANAAGELAPPMVLFKLKSIPYKISKQAPKSWGLGHSPKGWMTGETFYEYVTNVFYPWVERNNIELPIFFFLDGHCSHTTLPLSNFCREKNIVLIALYPNATHLLQPMDVSVFRPLKRIWKKTVYDWRNQNQFVKLKKENFCPLLEKALHELDPSTIANGFRKSGLSPFNADNVDYSKCVTSKAQETVEIEDHVKKDHLKFFESQISPTKLKAFRANKGVKWLGEESLKELFNVWRLMNNQICGTDEDRRSNLQSYNENQQNIDELAAPEKHNIEIVKTSTKNYNDDFQLQQPAESTPLKDHTYSRLGNFTGLTELESLDNNCSLGGLPAVFTDDTQDLATKEISNIEMFEVIEGELIKITPDLTIESLPQLHTPEKPLVETNFPTSREVFRTTGSNPIYLTPRPTKSDNNGLTILSSEIVQVEQPISQNVNQDASKKFYGDLVVPTPFKDVLFWPEIPPVPNKSKVKIPSVITSDRWQIFAQQKNIKKEEKFKRKIHTKEKKTQKSTKQKSTQKQKEVQNKITGSQKRSEKEWYCRMCKTSVKLDMIQCLSCNIWYHTSCAEVQPNERTFHCIYCNNKE